MRNSLVAARAREERVPGSRGQIVSLFRLGLMRVLANELVMTLASPRGIASIFMLHRVGRSMNGLDPLVIRRLFEWLRQHRFELLDLEELFRRLAAGRPPRRAAAFTIDDGYVCQAEVAAPLFAEYGMPVTTFLTTGFLDSELWLWWDQIEYVLEATRLDSLEFSMGSRQLELDLGSHGRRRAAAEEAAEHLKTLPESDRLAGIAELAERAGVPIPEAPPPRYRPMTWEQARRCEATGMRFGPHTATHPILARTTDDQARLEITASWQRLQDEVRNPMPVFCYPNGLRDDFGPREIAIITSLGLRGAVSAEPGYATDLDFSEADNSFRVKRFNLSEEHARNLRYASGLERLWRAVRHPAARARSPYASRSD